MIFKIFQWFDASTPVGGPLLSEIDAPDFVTAVKQVKALYPDRHLRIQSGKHAVEFEGNTGPLSPEGEEELRAVVTDVLKDSVDNVKQFDERWSAIQTRNVDLDTLHSVYNTPEFQQELTEEIDKEIIGDLKRERSPND